MRRRPMLNALRASASRSSSPWTWRKTSPESLSRPLSSRNTRSPSVARSSSPEVASSLPAPSMVTVRPSIPTRAGISGFGSAEGRISSQRTKFPAAPLWVDTAQLFVLGRQGKEQLATEGVEGGGTVTRIVTGGTGNFAGWVGEQRQTFLGFNPTGGVNLRVTFI